LLDRTVIRRSTRITVARNLVLTAAYIGAARLGLALSFSHEHVTAVWPATGIAVAALLLFGVRLWPGIFVGALVANVLDGVHPGAAIAIAVGNTLAPVAACMLLRRVRVLPTLERLRDVMWLTLGGGLCAMTISATIGATVLYATGQPSFVAVWRLWWVGDAMGVVLLSPLLLSLFSKPLRESTLVRQWRQACVLLGTFAVVTTLAVLSESPAGYLVIPLALWIAMQLEQDGAGAAVLVMSAIDLWHATAFPEPDRSVEQQLMALQGVNATIALILFALAVVMSDRRRARDELRRAADELEDRIRSRTHALRESEKRLAQAQHLAHIGSFQWDAKADRNEWSEELFTIYGLDPSDGPPSFDEYIGFIREDVQNDVYATIEKTIATGDSLSHEYPIVLHDGTRKWVHAYVEVLRDDDGILTGLRGTCQDVTERRNAEEARAASETRFRALVQSAPDAVVVVDARGRIVLMNDQTTKMLGYESGELLGASVDVLLPDDLRDEHERHRHRYVDSPTVRPMGIGQELSARRKDGSLVPVDVSLSPVETDEGMLVFALMRDASERRREEEALRSALDKERKAANDLRQLDEAKSAFLSAVSHELRTPLTAILGFADLLQDPSIRGSEATMSDVVERLQFSAVRLGDLLTDLLDIDRLERGILEPHRRTSVLRDLVDRALGPVDVGSHPIDVHIDDAVVAVDPAQAERIIENLVSNAVKYTPAGTRIDVYAKTRTDGGVSITVTDHGPGIADDMKMAIFGPFVRGETGSFIPGTGLGLALVDRFAKLHGGRVWVEDREGGGAMFRVELPGPAAHTAVA
jgi:PAS domain S-box-containing protein